MNLQFIISPAARADAMGVQRSLETGSPGAGRRFRDDLEQSWRYIMQFPGGCRIRYRHYRFMPLGTFNYHVINSISSERIIVHSIRHMHQQPLKHYFGA